MVHWFGGSSNRCKHKGGVETATELKRFTISITPSMEVELNLVKKERYYKNTQSYMIRDLISRGLASLQSETEESDNTPKQST